MSYIPRDLCFLTTQAGNRRRLRDRRLGGGVLYYIPGGNFRSELSAPSCLSIYSHSLFIYTKLPHLFILGPAPRLRYNTFDFLVVRLWGCVSLAGRWCAFFLCECRFRVCFLHHVDLGSLSWVPGVPNSYCRRVHVGACGNVFFLFVLTFSCARAQQKTAVQGKGLWRVKGEPKPRRLVLITMG